MLKKQAWAIAPKTKPGVKLKIYDFTDLMHLYASFLYIIAVFERVRLYVWILNVLSVLRVFCCARRSAALVLFCGVVFGVRKRHYRPLDASGHSL